MEHAFRDEALFARWLKGDISDAERRVVEQHPDFPLLQRLLGSAGSLPFTDSEAMDLLSRFDAVRLRRNTGALRKNWRWWAIGAAGVATVFLFVWSLLQTAAVPPVIAATATGEQKTVTLPDGSTVRLNAVSSVEIIEKNWSSERRVRLFGEAFFQVKKSLAPFTVETIAGTVTVLGTSFNVGFRGGAFEVACYDGLVQAATRQNNQQGLRAGQQAAARNGRWQTLSTIADPWPAWMQGESRFGDAPVYEVFAELERQYHISISASGTEGKRFSGRFTHGDLSQALRMVCEPLGLQFAFEGRQVLIRSKF